MNHACGVSRLSFGRIPGACEIGKNTPPSIPSTTAMIDCQLPACSAVFASVATSAITPIAASTPARTRSATPTGLPHLAPSRREVATMSVVIDSTPRTKLMSSFPPRIEARPIGAASRRESVPSFRSSRRLATPNCTVKNRKNTAMPAAK